MAKDQLMNFGKKEKATKKKPGFPMPKSGMQINPMLNSIMGLGGKK